MYICIYKDQAEAKAKAKANGQSKTETKANAGATFDDAAKGTSRSQG